MIPSSAKDVGIPIVVQPGVWGEVFPEGLRLRPGFEEWWAHLLLEGDLYPYWFIFNHNMAASVTDDQDVTMDSDAYLISVQGTATRDTGSFRTQFYEVVDSETGLSHMRIGVNDQGLVGTGQHQAFLPHPYKMTAGQILLSRCLNLAANVNNVQIAIFGVKHWKLNP